LPPAEAGVHPTDGESRHQVHGGRSMLGAVVYLVCDDLQAEIKRLPSEEGYLFAG
jgi:predicted alpha/beta-hydrolase family hydrolase